MYTFLTKAVLDNPKACTRFARYSNNQCMQELHSTYRNDFTWHRLNLKLVTTGPEEQKSINLTTLGNGLLVRGPSKAFCPLLQLDLMHWLSRLHNNDAMLWGQDLSRCAHVLCWKSVGALSLSVRGPGPARRYGMQGLARWLHAWRWRTWQCLIWPPTRGGRPSVMSYA